MGAVGIALIGAIVYGSAVSLASGKYSFSDWLNLMVFGVVQGSVYGLIALGYTMVYGILRMINFAHGEVFATGAFTTFFLASWLDSKGFLDANPILGLGILVAFSGAVSLLVAVTLERVAYRPLRGAPRLIPLITAIGASFFLQYSMRGLYGSGYKSYPTIEAFQGKWSLLGIEVLKSQVVVVASAVVLMTMLYLFTQRTRAGQAMRAISERKDVAALMGIDVDRTIVITFAIGGSMAGAAGVLYALLFRQVNAFMGFTPGLKAFTAAVLGGIGNIPGAMVGGLFLGIAESLGPTLWLEGLGVSSPHQLKDVTAFTMLVLILIFRPTGIMGEQLSDRA
jgi:branched-chain amino acid transport system permease protein